MATISNADILAYEAASTAYDVNADYSIDGDTTKAKLFAVAVRRLLRYPTLVEKDTERIQWDLKTLAKQLEEVDEFVSYSGWAGNKTVVGRFCRE